MGLVGCRDPLLRQPGCPVIPRCSVTELAVPVSLLAAVAGGSAPPKASAQAAGACRRDANTRALGLCSRPRRRRRRGSRWGSARQHRGRGGRGGDRRRCRSGRRDCRLLRDQLTVHTASSDASLHAALPLQARDAVRTVGAWQTIAAPQRIRLIGTAGLGAALAGFLQCRAGLAQAGGTVLMGLTAQAGGTLLLVPCRRVLQHVGTGSHRRAGHQRQSGHAA
jgi:hypothetical protein